MMFSLITKGKGVLIRYVLIGLIVVVWVGSAWAQEASSPPLSDNSEQAVNKPAETLDDLLPISDNTQRFIYEPEGRRDPFVSLLRGKEIQSGERPEGIEGMNVSELVLTGILNWGEKGRIALFKGTDNKTYQRRVGDGVFKAKIISITKDSVMFEQKVYGPFGNEKPPKMIEIKLHPKKEEGL